MCERPIFGPVSNEKQFNDIIADISKRHPSKKLLFRGQTQLHESIRSGRARPDARVQQEVEAGWRALALRMLGLSSEAQHGGRVKAVLQHYGMPTHFVDLTSDSEVAAWFSTQKPTSTCISWVGNAFRAFDSVTYSPSDESHGYVLVLAIPDTKTLEKADFLVDLSVLPEEFVRPRRQKGWLLLDRPPIEPTPNSFWVATIKIVCSEWNSALLTETLFPPPSEDKAFSVLLSLPFVQAPMAYVREDEEKADGKEIPPEVKDSLERHCFAKRAINIPEYGESDHDWCIDHKWADFTVYEPHPMRMWKNWRFDLAAAYDGFRGDIRDTVKITLTPRATELLLSSAKPFCRWPTLGTDGIFFTFAALDHDKVSEHAPPYYGVWLQRDDDLVIEVPMESDNQILSVTPGQAYLFRDGQLKRSNLKGACRCGRPETHDQRVFGMLQLSSLIDEGRLILLPHPTFSQLGWYVVIAGDDARSLQPQVESFHKVMKAISKKGI